MMTPTLWLLLGTLPLSLLIAWLACWAVRAIAPKCGLVDSPAGASHKSHTRVTPLGGGLAIWLAVVLPLAFGQLLLGALPTAGSTSEELSLLGLLPVPEFILPHLGGLRQQSGLLWCIVGCGTVLMLLGLWDDLRGLDWRPRLLVQFAVAGVLVWLDVKVTAFVEIGWLTDLLTVLWIVALINSFNMLDNMDGLSAGVAAIAAAVLGGVMLLAPEPGGGPQWFVAGYLFLLCGALGGFLIHNAPPARLFMGDAGSYFVGLWLAVGTILATFTAGDGSTPSYTMAAPLCVLAVPLYDLVSVLTIRLRAGRSPFQADKNHFSHRLVALGMSRPRAVLTIYFVTLSTALGAPLLYEVQSPLGAVIVIIIVLAVLAIVAILEATGLKLTRLQERETTSQS